MEVRLTPTRMVLALDQYNSINSVCQFNKSDTKQQALTDKS